MQVIYEDGVVIRSAAKIEEGDFVTLAPYASVLKATGKVVVVVSHIQRFGCQPEKDLTSHGGQSRSWSAEQGKGNKILSLDIISLAALRWWGWGRLCDVVLARPLRFLFLFLFS